MTEQPTTTTDILTPPPSPGIFGTKIPSSVTLAIGVLLFFMPFVEIKCNNMSLQKISGMELATGFRVRTSDNSLFGNLDNMDSNTSSAKKPERKDPNIYALAALILGALGFVLAMFSAKAGGIGGLLTGILGAVCLVLLWIDVKKDIKTEMADVSMKDIQVSVDFTPIFYITVLVYIAAAVMSYKRMRT
jgi:hypothetical protein